MAKRKDKDEDHSFTAWLGFIAILVLFALVIGGKYKEPQSLVRPDFKIEAKEEPTPTPTLTQSEEIEVFGKDLFGKDWPTFKKIIWCESRFNIEADNGHDVGLAQINEVHGIRDKWLKNWKINLLVAHQLFIDQGLNPWKSSYHCWGGK